MLLPETITGKSRGNFRNTGHQENTIEKNSAYQWVAEHMPVILYTVAMGKGPAATKFFVSTRCQQILGYSQEEWTDDPQMWFRILHPEDRERVLADFLSRGHFDGETYSCEYRMMTKEGDVRWFRDEGRILRTDDRPPVAEGFILAINRKDQAERTPQDISKMLGKHYEERLIRLTQANEKLRERLELQKLDYGNRYSHIFEAAGDALLVFDRFGKLVDANRRAAMLFEFNPEEMLGLDIAALIMDDEHEETMRNIQKEAHNRGRAKAVVQGKKYDGHPFTMKVHLTFFKNDSSNFFLAKITDISEQVKAEEVLLHQVMRHEQIIQTLADGLFIIDREGKILKTNQAAALITGYSQQELVGMNVLKLRTQDSVPNTAIRLEKIMRNEPTRFEVKCRRKNGAVIQLEVQKNYIEMGDEKFFYSLFRNISARKQEETESAHHIEELHFKTRNLEEVNTALRELLKRRDEDKSELESRVIMNVKELVLPYVEKLKRADIDPQLKTCVEVLESNLSNIVSPFTSRLSSSLLNLTPTEIRVANLVKEGRSTKEIAELFNLSRRTIDVHRDNIRKKLGIKNKRANLRTHLSYMQ